MEFQNVTVVQKANAYYDGKVVSRTIIFNDGAIKTLGYMQPGTYTFTTGSAEIMEIFSGELSVDIPDRNEKFSIEGEGRFDVPAHSSFTCHVKTGVDYCCSFVK
jgi:hypothetical protein